MTNSFGHCGVYCDSIQYINGKYHNVYTVTVYTFPAKKTSLTNSLFSGVYIVTVYNIYIYI